MTDFGSIYQLANRPTVALQDPMESYGKAMQMKAAMQQQELQGMQVQQQRQAMADAAAYQQGLKSVDPNDPRAITEHLNKFGKFKEAKDFEAARIGLQNEYLKMGEGERKQMEDMVSSIGAAAASVKAIKDPLEKWTAWQTKLPELAQAYAPTPQDTPRMREIKTNRIALMKQESDRLMAMQAPGDLDRVLDEHFNDSKTKVDWLKEAEAAKAAGEITGGIHADPQNNAFGVTKKGVPVPILGPDGKPQKMRPPGTAPAGLPGLGGGGGGKIDDEYLASLNPVDRDMITKIALGKYGGLDALKRTKGGQAKIDAFVRAGGDVSQVNNAVKWQEDARKTTPGSIGGTYLSVNKSLEHAQRALDVADQFPKEAPSDGGVIDYWSQRAKNTAWAVANPGKAKPLEHNWQITTSALLDETEKNILGGKPSVDQARTIEKLRTMPFTATRAEKDAAIQAVMDLTMGQYDAVENQRQQIQGKFAKADSMLSPKSQEIWANFNKRIGRKGETPGAATAPRTSLDAGSPTSSGQPQATGGAVSLDDYLKSKGH